MGKKSTEAAEPTRRGFWETAEGKRVTITVAAASHIEKGWPECPVCTSFHGEGIKHAQMCGKKQLGTSLWRSLGASNTWGGCYLSRCLLQWMSSALPYSYPG